MLKKKNKSSKANVTDSWKNKTNKKKNEKHQQWANPIKVN